MQVTSKAFSGLHTFANTRTHRALLFVTVLGALALGAATPCSAMGIVQSVVVEDSNITSGTTYNVQIKFTKAPPQPGCTLIVFAEFVSNGSGAGQSLSQVIPMPPPGQLHPPAMYVQMTAPTVITYQNAYIYVKIFDPDGNLIELDDLDLPQSGTVNFIPPP